MGTFLLCIDGTNGDVYPFIRLARGLIDRGHRAVVASHEPYRDLATATGVEYVVTDTARAYAAQLALHERLLTNGMSDLAAVTEFYERSGLLDQFRRQVAVAGELVAAARPGEVVVVGRHTTGLAPLLAAEAYGVPVAWVALYPRQHLVVELSARVYAEAVGSAVDDLRHSFGLGPVGDWTRWLASPDLTLGLWPDWFDGAAAPSGLSTTGFVLNDDAESGPVPLAVQRLLAAPGQGPPRGGGSRPGPVLVTGGSSRSVHPDWYRAAIGAAVTAERPVVVACRHRDLLPGTLPPDVEWFPDLPFASIMSRVAAVVHHGGVGTSARALASGTPQLILAHGIDRPDNGRRVLALGAGVWFPPARWGSEHLGPALRALLDAPPGPPRRVDPAASVNAACRHLEALVFA